MSSPISSYGSTPSHGSQDRTTTNMFTTSSSGSSGDRSLLPWTFRSRSSSSQDSVGSGGTTKQNRRVRLRNVFKKSKLPTSSTSGQGTARFYEAGRALRRQRREMNVLEHTRNELLNTLASELGYSAQDRKKVVKQVRKQLGGGRRREDQKIRNVDLLSEWMESQRTGTEMDHEQWERQNGRLEEELQKSRAASEIVNEEIRLLMDWREQMSHGGSANTNSSNPTFWTRAKIEGSEPSLIRGSKITFVPRHRARTMEVNHGHYRLSE
ncbi:hypothetical protein CI109_107098 [Kwoniella shandongensis]|uniref:Uncharacterized protein n=1 Tax=Kwoniella shandongensis TaxID=1734106 RepID=A0A5M6C313_9TREE|nr:uncharacterized protein CI109_002381 [Kwoniella shandongensis]KAA5529040.1 hypothetical protein CI109_002381 [Kwoniella shandongensis]